MLTFDELATEYVDGYAKPNKRSWKEDQRQLDATVLPKWRTRPAAEISAENLLALLNLKVKAGAPVAANRLRALSRIFTFAAEQRLPPPAANPVIGVKKPTKEVTRDRVLTDDEIRRLWEACATQKGRDRVDVRGHDLRRTAASLMASGGVPRFVISRVLNHSEEHNVTSIYDRYGYDAEKRAAIVLASAAIGRAARPVCVDGSSVRHLTIEVSTGRSGRRIPRRRAAELHQADVHA